TFNQKSDQTRFMCNINRFYWKLCFLLHFSSQNRKKAHPIVAKKQRVFRRRVKVVLNDRKRRLPQWNRRKKIELQLDLERVRFKKTGKCVQRFDCRKSCTLCWEYSAAANYATIRSNNQFVGFEFRFNNPIQALGQDVRLNVDDRWKLKPI